MSDLPERASEMVLPIGWWNILESVVNRKKKEEREKDERETEDK